MLHSASEALALRASFSTSAPMSRGENVPRSASGPGAEDGGIMELVWMVPVAGFGAVLFALWLAYDVLRRDAGTAAMQDVSSMIFEGAMAFLQRQYRTIAVL